MPRKDPETGERLSGYEQRRLDEVARRKRGASAVDDGSEYVGLDELFDPKDPDTGLRYVRAAQLIAFRRLCLSEMPVDEKRKQIREFSAVIGMTHPRAALEERVRHAEAREKRERGQGAAKVERGVQKPATARPDAPPAEGSADGQ